MLSLVRTWDPSLFSWIWLVIVTLHLRECGRSDTISIWGIRESKFWQFTFLPLGFSCPEKSHVLKRFDLPDLPTFGEVHLNHVKWLCRTSCFKSHTITGKCRHGVDIGVTHESVDMGQLWYEAEHVTHFYLFLLYLSMPPTEACHCHQETSSPQCFAEIADS